MAKYIVNRTSTWGEKPIEEAEPCKIHPYFRIKGNAPETLKKRLRESSEIIREFNDGGFEGYRLMEDDVWSCDIPDLHNFVEKYGKIILSKPDNKEGLWKVEIYDDYRE